MRRLIKFILPALVFLLSVSTRLYPTSYLMGPPRTIRLLTFNIHHGEGTDGRVDLERIARLIREQRADLVALQEVDRGVERTGRRDLLAELAQLTKMNYAFGKNIDYQGGDYGNAILSRFPIIEQDNHHFKLLRPSERRGLLRAVVDLGGKKLTLLATHIDFHQDDAERLSNVEELHQGLAEYGQLPLILCGDFNDVPGSRTHANVKNDFTDAWETVGKGDGFTYSSTKPEKRIDYVFIKKGARLRPVAARVIESDASDHLPLLVEIKIQ